MAKIPYANNINGVKVELNYASDVFLVDQNNFNKYQRGQRFSYYGGHYSRSPVNIPAPNSGTWYLIVIGGNGQYRYNFY